MFFFFRKRLLSLQSIRPFCFEERGWAGKRIRRADTRIICRAAAKRYQRPKPIPSQTLPPIRYQTMELPKVWILTQHMYVAVAARHGVTASRFPWPHIGGSREKKKTSFCFLLLHFFPPPPPCVPVSRPSLLLASFVRSSDLDFLYTASAASPEILRPCQDTRSSSKPLAAGSCHSLVPTGQAETSPVDAIHQFSRGA